MITFIRPEANRFILLLFTFGSLSGQNLVPNPGFEEKTGCPAELTNNFQTSLRECRNWVNAHQGSCDYFNQCMRGNNARLNEVPFIGQFPEARTDSGLIGFVACVESADANMREYREYPMTELQEPLIKDVEYYIEFYVKLSPNSFLYTDHMETVFLSDLFLIDRTRKNYEILKPFLRDGVMSKVRMRGDFSKSKEWVRASAIYVAKGGERFLFIGNTESFVSAPPKKRTDTIYSAGDSSFFYAYYFLDDVTVESKIHAFCLENFVPGRKFILHKLQFETDLSQIDPISYPELEKLIEFLMQKPEIQLEITGHTDMVGDRMYNMKLSFERAKEVKNYLVAHKIDGNRIKALGMGSARPLASNATEAGRALNRRVEILLR